MPLLDAALRGAHGAGPRPGARLQTALVVGAGGALGSALLGEALVAGRFQQVAALVAGPLRSALRGLKALPPSALQGDPVPLHVDVAFIVFERARHANGRDEAFVQPDPASLVALAGALHARGVRRLLVVVPHAPALLPGALRAGFASVDEHAVAALGFEQLVFLRTAQAGAAAGGAWPARFAGWWLSQLSWMVPSAQAPVRAVRLAALVVTLARLLPGAAAGTRVAPPELMWQANQAADPEATLAAWLSPP